MLPLKAQGENPPSPLLAPGDSGHSLALGCITPISDAISTWPFLYVCVFSSVSYKDSCHWIEDPL